MKKFFEAGTRRRTMKFAGGILAIGLFPMLAVTASAQTGETAPAEKPAPKQDLGTNLRVDSRPYQVFYLNNVSQQNDANEIVTAVRNMMPPDAKIILIPSQNAIVMRATTDELALAQKILKDLDRPKKTYRLTYTISEIDNGKRVGVQHFALIVTAGQRTLLKQGNKVPLVTGSNAENNSTQTQVTYIDVGLNLDATLDEFVNGVRLSTKVSQLGVAEERSGVGVQDPVIRQTALEGTSFLIPGKPVILGSLDVPGSVRHLDIDVMMEPIG
jgi:type II/III secretion system protein